MSWEAIFQSGRSWNRYPPEELIRFCTKLNKGIVYDFGCGPGAGPSWYLIREGWTYFGCDSSVTAMEKTRQRCIDENLPLPTFDSTQDMPDASVDLFIDIQSMQHVEQPKPIIAEAHRILKPQGKIFSMWVTDESAREPYDEFGFTRFIGATQMRRLFADFAPHVERSTRTNNGLTISLHILTGEK